MPTRSGRRYLVPHKCSSCHRYYSHENFNYKCSSCWEYCEKNDIMTSKEFGDKCRQWAKENTMNAVGRHFMIKNKNISDAHLLNLLKEIYVNTGKYISAETGLELYKARPTCNRGHIIGSFVADWWEIKSKTELENKKWPGYLDCYYGFWSNPIESWSGINSASIPPKLPPGPKMYSLKYKN